MTKLCDDGPSTTFCLAMRLERTQGLSHNLVTILGKIEHSIWHRSIIDNDRHSKWEYYFPYKISSNQLLYSDQK